SATSTKPNSPLRTTGGVGGRLVIPLASLDTPNSHLLISLGGLGGTGSSSLVGSPTRAPQNHLSQAGRRKVRRLRPARKGAVRKILLELKLIADVGMVGFPNAGKSSLMRLLCRADAKVGRYAFTTVEPRVGVIEFSHGSNSAGGFPVKVSVADLPGLVSGASSGRGKGHKFLRHVERTKCLLFVLDAERSGDRDYAPGAASARRAAKKDDADDDDDDDANPNPNPNPNDEGEEDEGGYGLLDLQSLLKELKDYDRMEEGKVQWGEEDSVLKYSDLATRPAVIAVNKLDLLQSDEERVEAVNKVRSWVKEVFDANSGGSEEDIFNDIPEPIVVGVSAKSGFGLGDLAKAILTQSRCR
ncbi:hypothetical protein ScalyP_jg7123, partial [Parmales sp. scaly parma]